jgi:phage portal protein BeeE
MRKLAWRANHPDHKSEIKVEDLLKHGNAALERVREENKQMREAYWTLKRRYTEEK